MLLQQRWRWAGERLRFLLQQHRGSKILRWLPDSAVAHKLEALAEAKDLLLACKTWRSQMTQRDYLAALTLLTTRKRLDSRSPLFAEFLSDVLQRSGLTAPSRIHLLMHRLAVLDNAAALWKLSHVLLPLLARLHSSQLAVCAWALAKGLVLHERLWHEFGRLLQARINEFSLSDVAMIAWAFARIERLKPQELVALKQRVLQLLKALQQQQLQGQPRALLLEQSTPSAPLQDTKVASGSLPINSTPTAGSSSVVAFALPAGNNAATMTDSSCNVHAEETAAIRAITEAEKEAAGIGEAALEHGMLSQDLCMLLRAWASLTPRDLSLALQLLFTIVTTSCTCAPLSSEYEDAGFSAAEVAQAAANAVPAKNDVAATTGTSEEAETINFFAAKYSSSSQLSPFRYSLNAQALTSVWTALADLRLLQHFPLEAAGAPSKGKTHSRGDGLSNLSSFWLLKKRMQNKLLQQLRLQQKQSTPCCWQATTAAQGSQQQAAVNEQQYQQQKQQQHSEHLQQFGKIQDNESVDIKIRSAESDPFFNVFRPLDSLAAQRDDSPARSPDQVRSINAAQSQSTNNNSSGSDKGKCSIIRRVINSNCWHSPPFPQVFNNSREEQMLREQAAAEVEKRFADCFFKSSFKVTKLQSAAVHWLLERICEESRLLRFDHTLNTNMIAQIGAALLKMKFRDPRIVYQILHFIHKRGGEQLRVEQVLTLARVLHGLRINDEKAWRKLAHRSQATAVELSCEELQALLTYFRRAGCSNQRVEGYINHFLSLKQDIDTHGPF